MSELFKIRYGVPADIPFIASSWSKSYQSSAAVRNVRTSLYFDRQKQTILHLLQRSQCLVICLREDEDAILGYVVFEKDVLHFVYVKEAWRKHGIATRLVSAAGLDIPNARYSHRAEGENKSIEKILRSKLPNWKYDFWSVFWLDLPGASE